MIQEFKVKPEWVSQANILSEQMGSLNKSITHGEGNVAGFIGELCVHNLIGGTHNPTVNYDIILNDKKYDVKTKRCTSVPLPNYECSIAAYNPNQECDYYIFTRVLSDYSNCWILGYISKKEYLDNARYCKKGEKDEKSSFGWRFKANCYNLEINKLNDINDLLNLQKNN
jgi:hypothetical protein